jgi:hypothetical protein
VPEYGEASAERTVVGVINSSWPELNASASTELAHQMIAARNTEGLLANMPWSDWVQHMGQVVPPLGRQVGRSIASQMQGFQSLQAGLSMTNVDAVSVRYAHTEGAKLVANLQESQRAAVRLVMGQAMNGEHTVDQAARMIRGTIGLHPAWAQAVVNFRERQIAQLSRTTMPPAKALALANKRADTYQARLVSRRAMNVAHTEIQTASNLGRYATWAQMVGNGLAKPTSMKEWSANAGACSICSSLSGQQALWDQPFDGGYVMPPAHTNCRCTANLLPQTYSNPILNPRPIDWTAPYMPGRDTLDAIGLGSVPTPTLLTPDPGFSFDQTGESDGTPSDASY